MMVKKKVEKEKKSDKKYVIVRTESAGVYAGYIASQDDAIRKIILTNARWLWYWDGAATLAQLAMEGVKAPDNCKFPMEMKEITLYQVISIIPCTEKARKNIAKVPVWKK